MNLLLLPPPPLRGILASVLFALLSVSVSENAAAQAAPCSSGEVLVQDAGPAGVPDSFTRAYDDALCVPRAECTSPLVVFAEDWCVCAGNSRARLDNGTPNDLSDDACEVCPEGGVPMGTTCGCPEGQVNVSRTCQAPTNNGECATAFPDGSQPIFDNDETDKCRPREGMDCMDDHELADGECVPCLSGETSTNGAVCTAAVCTNSGDVLVQEIGGLDVSSGCVSREDCVASNLDVAEVANIGAVCQCSSDRERLSNGTENDVTDDICIDCPDGSIVTGTTCGECPAGQVAHPDGSICRLPTNNEECARAFPDGSQPFYDASDAADHCRPTAQTDCADNHVYTFVQQLNICAPCPANSVSTGGNACEECPVNEIRLSIDGSCVACPVENEVRVANAAACSCEDPHVEVGGECRLPTGNTECATVGDGSAPIFDEDEPTNCRALDGTDCPTGQVLLTGAGACSACTGLLTPNTERTACECADPNVEVGGECRLPTGNAECATVGDGSTPIFDENEPTNCRALDGTDCPTGQVLLTGAAACSDCTAPRTANADRNACDCPDPNVEVGGECRLPTGNAECATVGDGSTPIFDENEPTNCRALDGTDCPAGQVLLTGAAACSACTGLLTPNDDRDACECADPNVEVNGECQAEVSSCPDAHHRPVNNVCTECDRDQHLVNGACVACPDNEVRATEDAACECNPPNVEVGNECQTPADCMAPLTANDQNECHCPDTHFGDTDSCVAHANCPGENVTRNSDDNTCVCADNSEGTPETACTACTGGKTSQGGADCACPADTLPFENSEGMCEASREGTCMDPQNTYNSETNMCECPSGQRLNADESDCEAIPASGGGGSSGGGAAAALIAVPVVLIGGYWLLGGFDYVDQTYNLSYQGENDTLSYRGDAGFDLNHGSLSSYARAIQSNGDAVSYESGISYKEDFYSLNYAAYESKSIYDYDLSARLNYGSGPWSISPTADAEFNYSADSEDWTSTAGAGLTAAWISHKWNVRAHSAFAGDLNHGLDVEFRF